jgi:hypothetical protein
MFLDKLWVRIKGDLLIMKDDLAAGESLRERAAILLARLENLIGNRESEGGEGIQEDHAEGSAQDKRESARTLASGGGSHPALQDIHREWEELVKLREEKQEDSKDSQVPRPNPRSLG